MSIKNNIDQLRNGRPLEPFPKWTNPNKPAESLINTTLVMHNKFKTAKPKFDKFLANFPHVQSVDDLDKLISEYNRTFKEDIKTKNHRHTYPET